MGRSQGLQRAQAVILLGLAGLACKASGPEREPAGEAPPFHDQILHEGMIAEPLASASLPIDLPVDVRRDSIHVRRFELQRQIFPRGGTGEVSWSTGVPVRVPGRDDFLVWYEARGETERHVFAAPAEQAEQSWPLLEYERDDAVGEPIVVGDRVAVLLQHGIAHAPLSGGPPGLLALKHTWSGPPSGDEGRLVWVARDDARELVMSTDASFAAAEVEYERSDPDQMVVGAVLVGDSLVFASVELSRDTLNLVVRRKRADGSLVELLWMAHPGDVRLLADGTQAWLYTARKLWWIGPDSHAKVPEFDAEPIAIGADDGLLFWYVDNQLHVAGQPTVEFATPSSLPPAKKRR